MDTCTNGRESCQKVQGAKKEEEIEEEEEEEEKEKEKEEEEEDDAHSFERKFNK